MTNLTVSERRRLTAIRASWLFDGTGSVLISNPLVVLDGAVIRSVESGGDVPFVAGTDAGIAPVKPHGVLACAPPMLRDIGLGPGESLRAITSVAAGVCGLAHRKGRIAPGYDADLLAVDGDPLVNPAALQRVHAVYARGAFVAG